MPFESKREKKAWVQLAMTAASLAPMAYDMLKGKPATPPAGGTPPAQPQHPAGASPAQPPHPAGTPMSMGQIAHPMGKTGGIGAMALKALPHIGDAANAAVGLVTLHGMVKDRNASQGGAPAPAAPQGAAPAQAPQQAPHLPAPASHPQVSQHYQPPATGGYKAAGIMSRLGEGLNSVGTAASKLPGVTRFVEEGSHAANAANIKRMEELAEKVRQFSPIGDLALQKRRGAQLVGAGVVAAPAAAYGTYRGGKALFSAPNKGKNTAAPLKETQLIDKDASLREGAFKVGFLFKLAEAGVAPRQLFEQLVKSADGILDPFISGGVDAAKQMAAGAGTGLKYLGGAALAAPIVGGAALGVGKSLLDAPNAKDLDLMRKAELLGLYNRLSQDIQQRQIHRRLEA